MFGRMRDFDFYRKIPKDLTETTSHGSFLSICAALFMLILFICELWAFLSEQVTTNIMVDFSEERQLRVSFNITVLDLPCHYAVIDVVDALGTRKDNVTKNIQKWTLHGEGIRRLYEGLPDDEEVAHDDHHDLAELESNGIHALSLTDEQFGPHLAKNDVAFVNFYAPWCIWCQRLEPVWEALAEKVDANKLPVTVVKIDCVANMNLCQEHKIQAFPTLRLFRHGTPYPPDYRSDRTVTALLKFLDEKLEWHRDLQKMTEEQVILHMEELHTQGSHHTSCQMMGYLLVNRVPGNFHIEARSKNHNLNPKMANLSHIVHHLSFGPVLAPKISRKLGKVPTTTFNMESTRVMDGKDYTSERYHEASHHYIKVVPTHLEISSRHRGKNAIVAYPMVAASQQMKYYEDEIPEARFSYDISPMTVVISTKGKHWYEFITSICALIGGTFTVVGLLSGFLAILFKPKKL